MTENEIKTEGQLKEELLNFVNSVATEFPRSRKSMERSIPQIKADVVEHFSPNIVFKVGLYLSGIIAREGAEGLTDQEAEFLIKLVVEHEKIMEESGNNDALLRTQKLERVMTLGLRARKIIESAGESMREASGMMLEACMHRDDENFVDDEKTSKLERLTKKAKELTKEKCAILEEIGSEGADPEIQMQTTILAKEIVAAKIRRLNRISATIEDICEKNRSEELIAKIKKQRLSRRISSG